MPMIQFDVLLPEGPAHDLEQTFRRAVDILVHRGHLDGAAVDHEMTPEVAPEVEEMLRENHRNDHDGEELVGASMHRYLISAEGPDLSYNRLAMSLSRILTPRADLPNDPVMLERETPYEVPAYYPWTVEIRR